MANEGEGEPITGTDTSATANPKTRDELLYEARVLARETRRNDPNFIKPKITQRMRDAMEIISEGLNGDHVFSSVKAVFGFIPQSQYLEIIGDNELYEEVPTDITVEQFGKRTFMLDKISKDAAEYAKNHKYIVLANPTIVTKLAFLNYLSLKESGMDKHNAFVASALRARWIQLGCLGAAIKANKAGIEEISNNYPIYSGVKFTDIIEAESLEEMYEADAANAEEFLELVADEHIGMSWVVNNAELIWAMVEYVMRVRGHHYKEEYTTLYSKYFKACCGGSSEWPEQYSFEAVCRIAIHPFGLAALPIMTAHFAMLGLLADASIIRFSGAPNGMAVITTTAACLRTMSSEIWYAKFKNVYAEQIALIENLEDHILENKFSFHMASSLYGVTTTSKVTVADTDYTLDKIREVGGGMAAVAQGFIEALKSAKDSNFISEFSFSNAKSLEKHSANAPLAAIKLRTLIIKVLELQSSAKTVDGLIDSFLPDLQKVSTKKE